MSIAKKYLEFYNNIEKAIFELGNKSKKVYIGVTNDWNDRYEEHLNQDGYKDEDLNKAKVFDAGNRALAKSIEKEFVKNKKKHRGVAIEGDTGGGRVNSTKIYVFPIT